MKHTPSTLFLFGWLVALLLPIACSQTIDPGEAPPSPHERRTVTPSPNKKGVHLLLADTFRDWPEEVWPEHLAYAREASGQWGYVTQLIRSNDLDVARWQRFMDVCAELELTPIIRLATTPNPDIGGWNAPKQDADGTYRTTAKAYADFLSALDWPTEQHFVVVHNEPNHGNEWGGETNPAEYARFLIDVAFAVHSADSQSIILNAGFDTFAPHTNHQPLGDGPPLMDAESFIDGMIQAQPHVFTYIDAWASHPYPLGAFIAPPHEQAFGVDYLNGAENPHHQQPPSGITNRGINGYEWELYKLESLGVPRLPVFVTETSWRFDEPSYPSQTTAAAYVDISLRGNDGRYPDLPEQGWHPWAEDVRVFAVTPFAFAGDPARWSHSNWLQLADDGSVLGTTALFEAWKGGD